MIPKLLDQLVRAGMTEAQIGAAIGRTQASVNRMRHNAQVPSDPVGQKIRRLHKRRLSKASK